MAITQPPVGNVSLRGKKSKALDSGPTKFEKEALSSFKSMNLFEYEKSRASQKASTDKGLKKKLILPKLVLC